jgi:hypothetical protein
MSWTFYDAQGREKRAAGPPPVSEYALATGGTGVYDIRSVPTVQVWALPLSSVVVKSATADACFRQNAADGSVTILVAGWYSIDSTVAISGAIAANIRIDSGVWFNTTDTPVALNTNLPGLTALANATGDSGPAGRVFQTVSQQVFLAAGTRLGVFTYNSDTVTRNLYSERFSIARIGTGIQGPRGGSKWWTSGVTYGGVLVTDPADVVAPVQGDIFLYPNSGDTFSYDGQVWVYTGPLPIGGVEPSAFGLPPSSSAVDGQIVHMQDATMRAAGVRWSFAYSSFGNRWEFIGGSPYYLENDSIFSTVATHTVYQDVGMGFTLPYAGTYIVELGGLLTTAAVAGNAAILSVRFGGSGAQDAYGAIFGNAGATAANTTVFSRVKLALTGTQLDPQVQLRSNTANVVSVQRKRLACTPVFLNGV